MLFVGRHVSKLSGYVPAVPTPFQDNGAVDDAALERFCDLQVREGATALVVCGTTGEAPTLSRTEHDRIVRIAVNNLAGVPSIVFGVFGLGFFVYFVGGSIDRTFFAEALPTPTFGNPMRITLGLSSARAARMFAVSSTAVSSRGT